MADKSIRLEFSTVKMYGTYTELRKETNRIIRENTASAVEKLRDQSPQGTDGLLADSWKVIAPRRNIVFETEYKIINTDPLAQSKLFGRKAGKMPPVAALERWAGLLMTEYSYGDARSTWSVRQVAFLIARKIARKGTGRSQEDNVLGIRRDSTYTPGSIIDEMQKNIEAELNQIKIGFGYY